MPSQTPCVRIAGLILLLWASTSAPIRAQDPAPPAKSSKGDERFRLGLGLVKRGLFEEAAKEFEAFLAAAPRAPASAEAWYRLAVCRVETDRNEAALAAFESALKAGGPSFALRPECRYRFGLALKAAGKHAAAAEMLETLVREEGDKHYLAAAANFAAGEAWRDAKKPAEAERMFLAAAACDASPEAKYAVPAWYAAGFAALEVGAFDEAARRFAAAVARKPDHEAAAECRFLAGDALLRAGKAEAALPVLREAAKAGGEFADDAAYGAARALANLGRADEAEAAYRDVAAKFPSSPFALRARVEKAPGSTSGAVGRRRRS